MLNSPSCPNPPSQPILARSACNVKNEDYVLEGFGRRSLRSRHVGESNVADSPVRSHNGIGMATNRDQPLNFHKSLNDLVDTFRNVIASMTWLKASAKDAQEFYKNYLYITELASSVTTQEIKVDKSILTLIEKEGFGGPTPLFT